MVDVPVSPGVPKPWLARQKQIPVLSSEFILGGSASRSNVKGSFSFHENPTSSSAGNWDSVLGSPILQDSELHPQKRRLINGSTRSVSHHDISKMSRVPLSMSRHPVTGESFYDISKMEYAHGGGTLPPYSPFMTAPAMKTTSSSSGSSSRDFPLDHTDEPLRATTASSSGVLAQSMPMMDTGWVSETPSFCSGTEETPSLSSSFDFMDLPKEEPVIYHGLPFQLRDQSHALSKTISNPHYIHSALPEASGATWLPWPVTNEPVPWPQHHFPGARTEEQIWAPAEYLASPWSAPETITTGGTVTSPATQPFPHLDSIQLSSLNHNHNHNHQPIKLSSTLTPSDSAPEHNTFLRPDPTAYHLPAQYTGYTSGPVLSGPEPTSPIPPPIPQTHPTTAVDLDQHAHTLNEAKHNIQANIHYSDTRNAFLIECKRRGLSYKDIKRIGGFKEAESTLRGRFRTLTKAKEQRVRKPKWQERDVCISHPPSPSFLPTLFRTEWIE